MTNCPNCGSPIEPHECMCKYCGTYYFDLTAFEMHSNKNYYIKFKQQLSNGKNVIITALARPCIESVETRTDSILAPGPLDGYCVYLPHASCDINVRFSCVEDPITKRVFMEERE